jgi:hypothetical protein
MSDQFVQKLLEGSRHKQRPNETTNILFLMNEEKKAKIARYTSFTTAMRDNKFFANSHCSRRFCISEGVMVQHLKTTYPTKVR